MIALQANTNRQPQNGPRPINLKRDLSQIVDLLELVFNQQLRRSGRRHITPSFGGQPLMWRFLKRTSTIPGFVWEEDGRIVGNVSLLNTEISGRYLIANVGVHPEFRRRGIALGLMQETIKWTEKHQAEAILLQVEEANHGAIKLYHALGFNSVGTVQLWEIPYANLRHLPVRLPLSGPDRYSNFSLRQLHKSEWEAAYELDTSRFHPDLNWPEPLKKDHYKRSLSNWWHNFSSGRQEETWVAVDKQDHIIGLAAIESEWARPHNLKLRIRPEWQGTIERPLLAKLIRRLRYLRRRPVHIEHLNDDYQTLDLFQDAGMRHRRTLMTMRLDLSPPSP